jgi:hypothetical protein
LPYQDCSSRKKCSSKTLYFERANYLSDIFAEKEIICCSSKNEKVQIFPKPQAKQERSSPEVFYDLQFQATQTRASEIAIAMLVCHTLMQLQEPILAKNSASSP